MDYQAFLPADSRVRRYVRCVWTLARSYRSGVFHGEMLWARLEPEIVFHRSGRYVWERPSGPLPLGRAFFLGMSRGSCWLSAPQPVSISAARLEPWTPALLARCHASDLVDRVISSNAPLGIRLDPQAIDGSAREAAALLASARELQLGDR